MSPTIELTAQLDAAIAAMGDVSRDVSDYTRVDDATLTELARLASLERQLADTHTALIAGEIAVRSDPALGHAGLAQRNGFRTPAEMVRVTGRSTLREASEAIRVGTVLRPADADPVTGEIVPNTEPWLAPVTAAVIAGRIPIASADAIRAGLGAPTAGVTVAALTDAATALCLEATTADADRLHALAREYRTSIDMAGVADRERERHNRRSLKFSKLPDGMSRLTWMMDPETAAVFGNLYDRATSPRRGGPRFADPTMKTQADAMVADTRTTEQLASDVFLDLLRHGADADSSQLLGSGAPVINVHVLATELNPDTCNGAGVGRIEGQADPVSIHTVERLICSGVIIPVIFDATGQALDTAREDRLYNRKQKRALAARDGGCDIDGCDRPPSWTEAHHIIPWAVGGTTDMNNAVLLCRHHHMLIHNNGWNIQRIGTQNWLIPPPDIDPEQVPRLMQSKSATHKEFLASLDSQLITDEVVASRSGELVAG